MANRTLACIRTMLNFAIDHDWIDANPARAGTKTGARSQPGPRPR